MPINIMKRSVNREKSLIETLRKTKGLPFQNELSSELIQKQIGNIPHRERIFSPEVTLHTFLSQVISADPSCQAVVAQVAAHGASEGSDISVNTAAYCKARLRLPEEALSGLARDCGQELEKQTAASWLWRGRAVKLIDGSCLSMPDTPANQAVYPQPETQKKALAFR